MPPSPRTRIIHRQTPESRATVEGVRRAMRIAPRLNRLTFDEPVAVRAVFSELIGQAVDESFLLIPPFFTDHGVNIRIGRNVFINQNRTFCDTG